MYFFEEIRNIVVRIVLLTRSTFSKLQITELKSAFISFFFFSFFFFFFKMYGDVLKTAGLLSNSVKHDQESAVSGSDLDLYCFTQACMCKYSG